MQTLTMKDILYAFMLCILLYRYAIEDVRATLDSITMADVAALTKRVFAKCYGVALLQGTQYTTALILEVYHILLYCCKLDLIRVRSITLRTSASSSKLHTHGTLVTCIWLYKVHSAAPLSNDNIVTLCNTSIQCAHRQPSRD
jgi:hypothetical protein